MKQNEEMNADLKVCLKTYFVEPAQKTDLLYTHCAFFGELFTVLSTNQSNYVKLFESAYFWRFCLSCLIKTEKRTNIWNILSQTMTINVLLC